MVARSSIFSRARSPPERPFILVLLLLSGLALLSFLRHTNEAQALGSQAADISKREDLPWAGDENCHHVHRYALKDQCAFVQDVCTDEEAGLFSYLQLYFCRMPRAKPLAFTIIAVWTALLFTTIGVAASDFFCINLSTISALLGLSESMAGVTFLAFGNGSPDVFSTFAAVKSHSGSLAIGELIGAAGFITAVVAGSMAIIRPFHVYKKSFLRDVGFFVLAVAFSMVFLANGALALWESAVMVAFYVFYVLVVVVWHWYLTRRRQKRDRESAARGHYTIANTEEVEAEEEYHDEEVRTPRIAKPVSTEDLDALERENGPDDDADLENEETRDKWMGELTSNMRVTRPPGRSRTNTVYTPIRPSLVGALEFRAVLSSLEKSRNIHSPPISMRRYSDAPYYTSAQQSENAPNGTPIEGAQNAYEASMHDRESDGLVTLGQRGRAVSANDAASLRLSEDLDRTQKPGGGPATEVTRGRRDPNDAYGTFDAAQHAAARHKNSPMVSITSPQDEYFPPTRARANTADLLAPPGSDHGPTHNESRWTASPDTLGPKPERPKVAIPSPSRRGSPKMSPKHSPYLAALSRSSSGVPSMLLPEPEGSPLSPTLPSGSHLPKRKRLSWWPYKLLPSPSLVAGTLFPTIYGWRNKTHWERLLGVCTAPSFFLLTITLPVVEPTKEDEDEKQAPPTGSADNTIKDFADGSKSRPQPKHHRSSQHPHSIASAAVAIEEEHRHSQPSVFEPNEPPPPVEDHASVANSCGKAWNRWLVLIQSFTAPLFVVLVLWANLSDLSAHALLKPTLYSLLASLVVLALLLTTTTPTRPPRWHFLLCFVGFAVSITWISTIANEVVGVLKAIGVIFNISDAILGLTIFAVGNSLGDLVADITVARLGYPVMALSACFGGPMLNILLGIGLSGIYMMVDKAEKRVHRHPDRPVKFKPYHVEVSTTLLVSAITLLITLIGLLIAVPLNGWKMDRRIGWGLIGLWIVGTVFNVVVEVTGWGDDLVDELSMVRMWNGAR